jgi:release factor H-coupled RctB family protein
LEASVAQPGRASRCQRECRGFESLRSLHLYQHFFHPLPTLATAVPSGRLVQRDTKLNRWAELRFDLEHPWEGDVSEVLAASGLAPTEFDQALGTIGGGNHFAELQRVEQVLDSGEFKRLGLGKQQLVVLVHSGSRGLGESILREYVTEHQASGSEAESFAAAVYLRGHDQAVRWAKANRALIARRLVEALGAEAECLWDGCHNSITPSESEGEAVWMHRKGAVAAENGPVMIPGSRGSLSCLVKPTGDGVAAGTHRGTKSGDGILAARL